MSPTTTPAIVCPELVRWFLVLSLNTLVISAAPAPKLLSASPQPIVVHRDDLAGILSLSTPYYVVEHDLKRGGAISAIRLTHGRAGNLLLAPIEARIRDHLGTVFSNLRGTATAPPVRTDGLMQIVSFDAALVNQAGVPSGVRLKSTFEYHWGYVKVRQQYTGESNTVPITELCPLSTTVHPSLTSYGYREGTTEIDGAPAFSFGSCKWGRIPQEPASKPVLKTSFVPRYLMMANAGVEGLEWFVGSDLWPWEVQPAGRRGQGLCLLEQSQDPAGIRLTVCSFASPGTPISFPSGYELEFYLGFPLLEGHALTPWFHTSFNRNRGNWVSPDQVQQWAASGIQTVHCHNDGDYYDDGLFWRDGSYPPYPDMAKYDKVIDDCRRAGIRVATYFSNKELHPSTPEYQARGSEWGRKDSKGNLQHNFFRGKSEFGVQMCLRSGWLKFLQTSIDRVLKNHPLDGVYYDWNVALLCSNPAHQTNRTGQVACAHWDIDELLQLMEWTRQRVGPDGLVIIHNTTTPMFATENFANYIVANEWGYGKWSGQGPRMEDLPLEWSLVGARARGVISYGQIDSQAPRTLHSLFALEALLGGVTPWPASPETFQLYPILKPIDELELCRFADWRNRAVGLQGGRCASAVYSKPGEAWLILGNLEPQPQKVRCTLNSQLLPHPLQSYTRAEVFEPNPAGGQPEPSSSKLESAKLRSEGVELTLPATGALLLHVH